MLLRPYPGLPRASLGGACMRRQGGCAPTGVGAIEECTTQVLDRCDSDQIKVFWLDGFLFRQYFWPTVKPELLRIFYSAKASLRKAQLYLFPWHPCMVRHRVQSRYSDHM